MSTDALLTRHEDYIADTTHVSNSMLATFRKSPALYYGRYVAKTIPPKEDTEATLRGTLLHLSQSEPETWQDRFVIAPETASDGKNWLRRKGSQHEREWNDFLAMCEAEGKWNIPAEERETLMAMGRSLRSSPAAAKYLGAIGAIIERPIAWVDEETSLPCKCKPDIAIEHDGDGSWWSYASVIADIKTSRDPSPAWFSKAVSNLGYHHQCEFYRMGWAATHGEIPDFVFIVVGVEPPHDVFVYRLDIDAQAIAFDDNRRDLKRLADCYAFDQWHSPGYSEVQTIGLPGWAFKRESDDE